MQSHLLLVLKEFQDFSPKTTFVSVKMISRFWLVCIWCYILIPLSLGMWEQDNRLWPLQWLTNSYFFSWTGPIPLDSSTKASFHSSDTDFSLIYLFWEEQLKSVWIWPKLVLGTQWECKETPRSRTLDNFGWALEYLGNY